MKYIGKYTLERVIKECKESGLCCFVCTIFRSPKECHKVFGADVPATWNLVKPENEHAN